MFYWLQAVDDPSLCFLVIEPELFMFNYSLEISDEDVNALEIERPEDVEVLAIVTILQDPKDMTANLQGPIIINKKNLKAKQIISTDPQHKVKVPILKTLEENIKYVKKHEGGLIVKRERKI